MDRTNNELIANVGNFVNRALSFTTKVFSGIVPQCEPNDADKLLFNAIDEEITRYIAALDRVQLKEGLKIAMGISKLGNKFLQGMPDNILHRSIIYLFYNSR